MTVTQGHPAPRPARADEPAQSAADAADVAVSVLVPVLNEAENLETVLATMREQRYPGAVEFLLIDGGSTDGSLEILREAGRADPRFRLLHNPAGAIPNALNIGLREARGSFIARMDAHTRYPPDYLELGVRRLEARDVDWVSGPPIPVARGAWSRRVALALKSPLGAGGGMFRNPKTEVDIPSGHTGMWRRDTLTSLGGWDEEWPVNEDVEMGARIHARGGRVVCVPEMATAWLARDSLRGIARQYYRYGHFRVRTVRRHPESLRRGHLLPPAVLAMLAAATVPWRVVSAPARMLVGLYAAVVAVVSARLGGRTARRDTALLPVLFLVMHLAWAWGFVVGCVRFGIPWRAVLTAASLRR
jgi:succinoglycan biosynthesis protein ExoA